MTEVRTPNVGFIGLGRMGAPMARAVLRSGFPLTVYNRSAHRAIRIGEEGANVVDSPAEVAARSDVVITMLADAEAVAAVMHGRGGLLADPPVGLAVIEMSTIGPDTVRRLAAEGATRGVSLIDAPVSGSVTAAESATLTTIVGGDPATFERVRPVLAAMTRVQILLGPSGSGAAMKLALNGLIAATNQALAEALVVAERCGIERSLAYDAITASAIRSPFVDYKRSAFLEPDASPVAFTLALMQKDLGLYLSLAQALDVPLAMAAAAHDALGVARESQGDEADLAMVAQALREVARG